MSVPSNATAFLFPGQGSQSVGMMAGFTASREVVEFTFGEASEVLGYDLLEVAEQGPPERLNQTEVTQPALLSAGIATWRAWLAQGGEEPDYLAGHSLGEYTALVASGALAFTDAVALVAERGRAMQAATPAGTGGMAAILGLEESVLDDVCKRAAESEVVSCANFNAPGQIVIAGDAAAVERACELAREAGARKAIPLAVSVPSHCALMQPAARVMEEVLAGVALNPPNIPLIHNADVATHATGSGIRRALVEQLSLPVRWTETIGYLGSANVTRYAECGPGKVLCGLNRRIDRAAACDALSDDDALAAVRAQWEA